MRTSAVDSRRTYLWVGVIVLLSTLPLYVRQFDCRGTSGLTDRVYQLLVIAVAVIGIVVLRDRQVGIRFVKNLRDSPHILLYCSWLLISHYLISLVHGDLDRSTMFRIGAYVLSASVGYLVLPCAIGQRGIAVWWNVLLAIGTVVSGLGLFVALTGKSELFGLRLSVSRHIEIWDLYATSGPFHEPNIFGFASSLGVVAGLYRLSTKQKGRAVTLAITGVCAGATLFSWSRAMYLALPAAIVVWRLIGTRTRTRVLTILAASLVVPIMIGVAKRNVTASYFLQFGLGLTGRQVLWPSAIRAILDRPLTGYGMSPFILTTTVYNYGGAEWHELPMGAHNGFLDVGVQAGVLAPILYLVAITVAFLRLFRSSAPVAVKRSFAAAMIISVVAVTFLSYTLGGINYGSLTLTILFGMGNSMPVIYPQNGVSKDRGRRV